ncbi:MAG: YraN family protein [Coriobacteriales bacterium]|nr:YraN family protein [Coriobacteriales bacterium]
MTAQRKHLGKLGEEIACWYLEQEGLRIIERNWRCAAGEADIIAHEEDEIVFVEVKTRSDIEKGLPEDAITAAKRQRYERIAMYYLMEKNPSSARIRFDVIAILRKENHNLLRHHRDAFSCGD